MNRARLRRVLTSDEDYVSEARATESEPVAAVPGEGGGAGGRLPSAL